MPFTNEEAFEILAVYFECLQSGVIASRIFLLVLLSDYRQQEKSTVQFFEDSVVIALRNLKHFFRLHPYHGVRHQALSHQDFERCLDHCHWLLNMIRDDHQSLTNILWTYEATFNSNGGVNLHNRHYWSRTNPQWMQEVEHQGRFSVNVWCGIIGGQIIGPFIFEQKLNGNIYLHFLQNQLLLLLEDIPLRKRVNMFLQQDGCPAHFSLNVRRFLDNAYSGRGSLFPWPARSPDFTCMDFYLWERVKDIVFQSRLTSKQDLRDKIKDAIHHIPVAEVEGAAYLRETGLSNAFEMTENILST
ncbi:hypothetical protein D910_04878 [Dendroctonus ponderosae]|uniref:Tc1-like transposase DDE domain-containing protein n=1 Tax=Dendroctonus ponderosae TaxID=77166 RepID=U4UA67_DENPD|nr:hypothetical protein D910_04878 [Dendroctonus ponderosae]